MFEGRDKDCASATNSTAVNPSKSLALIDSAVHKIWDVDRAKYRFVRQIIHRSQDLDGLGRLLRDFASSSTNPDAHLLPLLTKELLHSVLGFETIGVSLSFGSSLKAGTRYQPEVDLVARSGSAADGFKLHLVEVKAGHKTMMKGGQGPAYEALRQDLPKIGAPETSWLLVSILVPALFSGRVAKPGVGGSEGTADVVRRLAIADISLGSEFEVPWPSPATRQRWAMDGGDIVKALRPYLKRN